uniref:LRRC37A/B like protein 1 C-terminal domain-containing protein n=1 Tax=Castor canadensis TaxID=51338 RepID=A0A8C0ZM26_CASCN
SRLVYYMSMLHVMPPLMIWAPRLLFMSLELWLLVQGFPIPSRTQDLVQLTSKAPGPTEPWSIHSLDRLPGLQQMFTPPVFAPPHLLTDSLLQFLDRDSGRQPSPEPDPFAAAHQELSDELNPEAVPMPNREQNQGPTLPPPLQSKTQTVSLDQASESQTFDIPVPPLDRQISKVAKFIVSRWKLKKDAAQHQRLDETVAGTPHQFANLQPVPAPEVTVQPPAQDQAEQDTSPSASEHAEESEPPPPQQEQLAQSSHEIITQKPEPLEKDELSPVSQGATAQPEELPEEPSPSQQESQPEPIALPSPAQPHPMVQTSPGQPQPTAQPPVPYEMTVPLLSQDESQYSMSSVTIQPLDLELPITSKPTTKVKNSPPVKKTRTPPPKPHQVTLPHPVQVQAQHPGLTEGTIQPVDLQLSITVQPITEDEPSPETSTQPPKPAAETKIQPSTSGQDQAQRPTLAVTEANNTTTPPPHALTVQTEPNATPYTNICELCTCRDESLLCVGLSPTQKLHRVPVPKPNTYKKVLTTLNFHGNAIDYIDKNTWKAYRWTEKLILSENRLTELRKDSFEGLLSLEYLILSRNPLTTVEDSHLFKLPALKYLDLGKTQVRLATLENILLMTLKLEKLILPRHMACCLCQFKYNIEFVCKTVKLHCDNECLTNTIHCVEEASIGNTEGKFMKVLQTRKKSTSTELTIEPERGYEDQNSVSFSGFINEQPLIQQLPSLIPNSDVRALLSRMIRTLGIDCSDPDVQAVCSKFILRTGYLMKVLSTQQEASTSRTDWDTDQWKTKDYISDNTDVQSKQKGQESSEKFQDLVITTSHLGRILATVLMILIIICIIEVRTTICSGFQNMCCLCNRLQTHKLKTKGIFPLSTEK